MFPFEFVSLIFCRVQWIRVLMHVLTLSNIKQVSELVELFYLTPFI